MFRNVASNLALHNFKVRTFAECEALVSKCSIGKGGSPKLVMTHKLTEVVEYADDELNEPAVRGALELNEMQGYNDIRS